MKEIEKGRRVPSEAVLRRIAGELDLDADLLLAAAGRVGEGAREYIRANPTAGVLFRRMSDASLAEQDVKKLLRQAEQMISKRDKDADGWQDAVVLRPRGRPADLVRVGPDPGHFRWPATPHRADAPARR